MDDDDEEGSPCKQTTNYCGLCGEGVRKEVVVVRCRERKKKSVKKKV